MYPKPGASLASIERRREFEGAEGSPAPIKRTAEGLGSADEERSRLQFGRGSARQQAMRGDTQGGAS